MNVFLDGIIKFLTYINDNWVLITTIVGLMLAIGKKIKSYLSKSNDEKIEIAKAQINEVMLKLVTKAECDWLEWQKCGEIKRSQVMDEIFTMYPILSTITNQEEVVQWIDDAIDNALKKMRKIFEENKAKESTDISAE